MLLGRVGDLDRFFAVFVLNLSSLASNDLDAMLGSIVHFFAHLASGHRICSHVDRGDHSLGVGLLSKLVLVVY